MQIRLDFTKFYNFEINFLCYILLVIIYENVCDKGVIKKKKNSRNYIFKINNVTIKYFIVKV